jgi:hypothetical protein
VPEHGSHHLEQWHRSALFDCCLVASTGPESIRLRRISVTGNDCGRSVSGADRLHDSIDTPLRASVASMVQGRAGQVPLTAKPQRSRGRPSGKSHRRSPWACDECRLRKRKCDGAQPCRPCLASDLGILTHFDDNLGGKLIFRQSASIKFDARCFRQPTRSVCLSNVSIALPACCKPT